MARQTMEPIAQDFSCQQAMHHIHLTLGSAIGVVSHESRWDTAISSNWASMGWMKMLNEMDVACHCDTGDGEIEPNF